MDFKVSNNGVDIQVETQKITKGKTAGTEYSAPNVNTLTLDLLRNFLGEQLLMDAVIRPTVRRVALGIHKAAADAANGDPEKYKDLYSKYLSSFSAVGESVSVLKERLADLMEQLGDLDDPKVTIVDGKPTLDQTDANTQKYVGLMLQIKTTNDALADKKEELAEAKKASEPATATAGKGAAVEA
jgi:hypothetical protein